jgi:hypothetical protein
MGLLDRLLDRLFGKKRAPDAATVADQARSQQMAGRETGQTAAEQAATRGRMETEMDTQRRGRAAAADAVPPCPHTTLTPRWDSVADMGNDEKVTSYTCQGCNQSFTAAEGRTLLATEAERLRRELGTGP